MAKANSIATKPKLNFQSSKDELDTMAADLCGLVEILSDLMNIPSEPDKTNTLGLVANNLDRMSDRLSAIADSLPEEQSREETMVKSSAKLPANVVSLSAWKAAHVTAAKDQPAATSGGPNLRSKEWLAYLQTHDVDIALGATADDVIETEFMQFSIYVVSPWIREIAFQDAFKEAMRALVIDYSANRGVEAT